MVVVTKFEHLRKGVHLSAMNRIATLFFVATAALTFASPALACDCAEVSQAVTIANASVIFEGQVIESAVNSDGIGVVVLSVTQSWKGTTHERMTVMTELEAATCGFHFEVGKHYLVYASDVGGDLHVSACGGTKLASDAATDRVALGAGVTPVDVHNAETQLVTAAPHASAAGCASCSVSNKKPHDNVAWLSVIAVLGFAASRRRR